LTLIDIFLLTLIEVVWLPQPLTFIQVIFLLTFKTILTEKLF